MSNVTPGSTPPAAAPGGGGIIPPPSPPKDPILILILNLLVAGGVGYLLIGQKTKGIVAIVAYIILLFVTCGIGSGIIAIVAAIDGYLQAQLQQQGKSLGEWTFFNDHK